jgi:hypothetical protein
MLAGCIPNAAALAVALGDSSGALKLLEETRAHPKPPGELLLRLVAPRFGPYRACCR